MSVASQGGVLRIASSRWERRVAATIASWAGSPAEKWGFVRFLVESRGVPEPESNRWRSRYLRRLKGRGVSPWRLALMLAIHQLVVESPFTVLFGTASLLLLIGVLLARVLA